MRRMRFGVAAYLVGGAIALALIGPSAAAATTWDDSNGRPETIPVPETAAPAVRYPSKSAAASEVCGCLEINGRLMCHAWDPSGLPAGVQLTTCTAFRESGT